MNELKSTNLCRICLKEGATYPIYEKSNNGDLYNKLLICLQCNVKEDAQGFPRHICSVCNNTLGIIINFIDKYKESTKILENSLKTVKKEIKHVGDNDTTVKIDDNPDYGIKVESDDHFDYIFNDIEDENPLQLLKEKQNKEPTKKYLTTRKVKTKSGCKTNKIASSILEGNFLWTGEHWCTEIAQTTIKKILPKPRRQTKIIVPNQIKNTEKKLCDLCGEIFKNQEKLAIHKKTVHFKNPVKCSKCPRICASEPYLRRHEKRKHGTKDFVCSTCGHCFAFKGELTHHFRNVHNRHLKPKKSFACKFCQKSYKCQKSVTIHERSVHTGLRPAECSVCGSCFYHEEYLREHMRLHTGETPFKCPICGRGYAQRGNMKSHLRIHRKSELDATVLSKMRPSYLKLLKA